MVKIRLARFGAKKKPFYYIVATDSRSPRDSKFLEKLGFYNAINTSEFKIDLKRFDYWKSKGAQCTNVVNRLIKKYQALNH